MVDWFKNPLKKDDTAVPVEDALADDPQGDPQASDDEKEKPAEDDEKARRSVHFGDEDYDVNNADYDDVTWSEVCRTCCCHTPTEWGFIFIGFCIVCGMLYFFLLGLELLSTSAKCLTGCVAGAIFQDANPLASVIIGMLVTVLLQSSSTTTSIIVSLVSSGLDVQAAIYMVMGANIGTSVTNTIVAMGQMGDGDQLERAFAGATVHDMFNFLSVAVLLPVEVATGYLYYLTLAMVPDEVGEGESWTSPFKTMLDPILNSMIISNSKLTKDVANGVKTCAEFYPTYCENGVVSYETCEVGLIGCDKDTNKCPAFFKDGAEQSTDVTSAAACLVIGISILILALLGLVWILKKMLMGASQRIIYKATSLNGYVSMVIGCLITMLVQSSSVTTSTLTPLVGLGIIPVEQMYPLTLGANIGTTVTGLLAASVSGSTASLQVALSHLFFNLTGIVIWYPIPFMRRIPIRFALTLGHFTRLWRLFPALYILVAFIIIPLILFALSALLNSDSAGVKTFGVMLTVICAVLGLWWGYYWWCQDGKNKTELCFARRERKAKNISNLPDNMDYCLEEIERLKEYTGLPEKEVDEEAPEKDVENGATQDASDENEEVYTPPEADDGKPEYVDTAAVGSSAMRSRSMRESDVSIEA